MEQREPWSEAELRKLRDLYPTLSAEACAPLIGRTASAIVTRARLLKIRKSRTFQKNQGFKPKPVGSERVRKGVLLRRTGGLCARRRGAEPEWKPVRQIVWEQANGPIPKGFVVVFKRGMNTLDSALITIDRLELVTPADIGRRTHLFRLPAELAELAGLRLDLNREIARRMREEQDERRAQPSGSNARAAD